MKKKLDTSSVINELRYQSVFFPPRQERTHQDDTPLPSAITKEAPQEPDGTQTHPVPPVRVVPPVPLSHPPKRTMKQRHPFDIYQDQYDSLKELAAEERKQGGIGSMSAMVREAIDKLIAEKRKI